MNIFWFIVGVIVLWGGMRDMESSVSIKSTHGMVWNAFIIAIGMIVTTNHYPF